MTLRLPGLINSICTGRRLGFLGFWEALETLQALEAFEVIKLLESSTSFCAFVVKACCRLVLLAKRLATDDFFAFWCYLTGSILLIVYMVKADGALGAFKIGGSLLGMDTGSERISLKISFYLLLIASLLISLIWAFSWAFWQALFSLA